MGLLQMECGKDHLISGASDLGNSSVERNWYAVFTMPQNEKSAQKQLTLREIETFLPTYETLNIWKKPAESESNSSAFSSLSVCAH